MAIGDDRLSGNLIELLVHHEPGIVVAILMELNNDEIIDLVEAANDLIKLCEVIYRRANGDNPTDHSNSSYIPTGASLAKG